MVATKPLISGDSGNKKDNSREISTLRKIEIRYETESKPTRSDKLNLGFLPDTDDKKQGTIDYLAHIYLDMKEIKIFR